MLGIYPDTLCYKEPNCAQTEGSKQSILMGGWGYLNDICRGAGHRRKELQQVEVNLILCSCHGRNMLFSGFESFQALPLGDMLPL